MRNAPTPPRASKDTTAEPVAPQPTIATRPAASRRWPSVPIPRNRICREYRSSNFSFSTPSLKEVTSFPPQNLYYSLGCLSRQDTDNTGLPRFIESRQRAQGHYLLRRYASFVVLIIASLGPVAGAGAPADAATHVSQEPQAVAPSSTLASMTAYAGRIVQSIELP